MSHTYGALLRDWWRVAGISPATTTPSLARHTALLARQAQRDPRALLPEAAEADLMSTDAARRAGRGAVRQGRMYRSDAGLHDGHWRA